MLHCCKYSVCSGITVVNALFAPILQLQMHCVCSDITVVNAVCSYLALLYICCDWSDIVVNALCFL